MGGGHSWGNGEGAAQANGGVGLRLTERNWELGLSPFVVGAEVNIGVVSVVDSA